MQQAQAAFDAARDAGTGATGVLRLGVSPARRYGLRPLFGELRRRHPRLRLRIRQQSSRQLVEDLRAGELDAAVTFCAGPSAGLGARRLLDAPAVAVVSLEHRLAGRDSVALGDLRDETFALADPREAPGYNAAVVELCQAAGFAARLRRSSAEQDPWETGVVDGGCVGLTDPSAVHALRRDVHVLALEPRVTFAVDLLWSAAAGEPTPVVSRLLAVAETVELAGAG